jgi:hypothetical protein
MEQTEKIVRLVRYSAPTKLDKMPFATQWKQLHDNERFDLFIQLGDEQEPDWRSMGAMMEIAFGDLLYSEVFLNECLRLYKNNNDKHQDILSLLKQKR